MLADEINKKFFSGSKSVKGKEITMIFSGSIEASDEEKVKLAKLFLLECVLLSKQKAGIDMTHMKMVNDDDVFDLYPWGRLVFEHTIGFFKRATTSLANISTGYGIGGFSYALISWAYEAIPTLSSKGYNISINPQKLPRMLNWRYSTRPDWDGLSNDIFDNDDVSNYTRCA